MAKKNEARKVGPAGNLDYVEWGSERHVALLGLRKADEGDEIQHEGFALVDMTAYGVQATPAYLKEILHQKVSTLNTPPTPPQSDDLTAPNYAPRMFVPPTRPASGTTF
jgi:hypothetical protein